MLRAAADQGCGPLMPHGLGPGQGAASKVGPQARDGGHSPGQGRGTRSRPHSSPHTCLRSLLKSRRVSRVVPKPNEPSEGLEVTCRMATLATWACGMGSVEAVRAACVFPKVRGGLDREGTRVTLEWPSLRGREASSRAFCSGDINLCKTKSFTRHTFPASLDVAPALGPAVRGSAAPPRAWAPTQRFPEQLVTHTATVVFSCPAWSFLVTRRTPAIEACALCILGGCTCVGRNDPRPGIRSVFCLSR